MKIKVDETATFIFKKKVEKKTLVLLFIRNVGRLKFSVLFEMEKKGRWKTLYSFFFYG